MVNKNAKPKQKKAKAKMPQRPSALRRSGLSPAWLQAVQDPFTHAPTSVPDEDCSPTCKCESRYTASFSTSDQAASPSTSHGLLIGVAPFVGSNTGVNGYGSVALRQWDSSLNAFTGQVFQYDIPNKDAICPPVTSGTLTSRAYEMRCTALKAKITYDGTELNRAGGITAGLCTIAESAASIASAKNPISAIFDGTPYNLLPVMSPSAVRQRYRRLTSLRNPDGSVEVTWIPSGVPQYQTYLDSSNSVTFLDLAKAGPCILFMITGDTTSTASQTGNAFRLEIVWHWEIKPLSRYAMAIAPSPSPYDPVALSACLNKFQTMSSVSEDVGGQETFVSDGGQSNAGSAWETVSSSLSRGAGALFRGLQDPQVQQVAFKVASQMAANQRRRNDMRLRL